MNYDPVFDIDDACAIFGDMTDDSIINVALDLVESNPLSAALADRLYGARLEIERLHAELNESRGLPPPQVQPSECFGRTLH